MKTAKLIKLGALAAYIFLHCLPANAMKGLQKAVISLRSVFALESTPQGRFIDRQHLVREFSRHTMLDAQDFFYILPKDLWFIIMQYLPKDDASLRYLAQYCSVNKKLAQKLAAFILLKSAGSTMTKNWQQKIKDIPFFKSQMSFRPLVKEAFDNRIKIFQDLLLKTFTGQISSPKKAIKVLSEGLLTSRSELVQQRLLDLLSVRGAQRNIEGSVVRALEHSSKAETLELLRWACLALHFLTLDKQNLDFQEMLLMTLMGAVMFSPLGIAGLSLVYSIGAAVFGYGLFNMGTKMCLAFLIGGLLLLVLPRDNVTFFIDSYIGLISRMIRYLTNRFSIVGKLPITKAALEDFRTIHSQAVKRYRMLVRLEEEDRQRMLLPRRSMRLLHNG